MYRCSCTVLIATDPELLEALIGDRVEPSKEHQPRPDRDLSKFRVEPSR